MIGPDHFREAERLLTQAQQWDAEREEHLRLSELAVIHTREVSAGRVHDLNARNAGSKARRCREAAQVHATLAHAAATAVSINSGAGGTVELRAEWRRFLTGEEATA